MNIKLKIQSLFSAMVTVVILAITILFMFVSIMIGGFYAAYLFMLAQGIEPLLASAVTVLCAGIFLFACIIIIRKYIIKIHKPNKIESIIEGFFNGLDLGGEQRL